jgi:hypothetical protein
MKKIMIVLVVGAVMWAGSVIRTEGIDKAFGGIFAPVDSIRESESSAVVALSPAAQAVDIPSQHSTNAGRVTGDVRSRLSKASGKRR